MHRNRLTGIALGTGTLLLLGACATVRSHWPFAERRPPAPEAVAELLVQAPETGSAPVVLQYWERNTLVVDLREVPATGAVVLRRRDDRPWPARIAFRVAPQRFEVLQVRGAQRVVLPVATADASPVMVPLAPAVYAAQTAALAVSWGARGAF